MEVSYSGVMCSRVGFVVELRCAGRWQRLKNPRDKVAKSAGKDHADRSYLELNSLSFPLVRQDRGGSLFWRLSL